MSVTPDPAEVSAPRDPADYRPRRLLGPGFWAMIGFSVVCVGAGAAVVALGPRLLAQRQPAAAQAPAAPLAALPAGRAIGPAAPAVQAALAPPAAPPAEYAQLADRLAVVEAAQARTASAAATALAASALAEAAQGSQPFPQELASLAAVTPASEDLSALRPLAESGAPSRTALAASFPDYAARAASASRAPGEGAGLLARLGYELSRIVTVRRVGDVPGSGADAVLARAERHVEDGDIAGALTALDALPASARDAVAPWRARAERRVEIDRRVGALRSRALQDLAQIARRAG